MAYLSLDTLNHELHCHNRVLVAQNKTDPNMRTEFRESSELRLESEPQEQNQNLCPLKLYESFRCTIFQERSHHRCSREPSCKCKPFTCSTTEQLCDQTKPCLFYKIPSSFCMSLCNNIQKKERATSSNFSMYPCHRSYSEAIARKHILVKC